MQRRSNVHAYGEPTFWLKLTESELAVTRRLTVILRVGDRSSKATAPKQWLPMFEPIPVYHLDKEAAHGGPLGFCPDDGTTVKIVRRTVGRLGDIVDADLRYRGGRAVPAAAAEVKRYFEEEMSPEKTFADDQVVTIYWVEYLPDQMPATD